VLTFILASAYSTPWQHLLSFAMSSSSSRQKNGDAKMEATYATKAAAAAEASASTVTARSQTLTPAAVWQMLAAAASMKAAGNPGNNTATMNRQQNKLVLLAMKSLVDSMLEQY